MISYGKQNIDQSDIDAVVDAFEAWSVHSYSGDYNPLHDHGVATPFGLSCILYLKVPEAIETKNAEDQNHLNNNSVCSFIFGFILKVSVILTSSTLKSPNLFSSCCIVEL